MAEAKKPAGQKPIVDVAHPGKTAPPVTSKPVIVTNRPMLKDPMVVADDDDDDAKVGVTAKAPAALSHAAAKPVVQPPDAKPDESGKAAESDDAPARTPEPVPTPENPKLPDAKPTDDDEPSAAEQTEQQLAAEAEADAKHDAEIQKLIDSKQYFVPINAVEKRRSKRIVLLGIVLSILLALAWVDIALDAGIIQINGVKPVSHFFSN